MTIFDRSWYGRSLVEHLEEFASEEDWRNREKWHDYSLAVNDMVQHTSTRSASWILVEGNDNKFTRIKALKTLCLALEDALGKND